MDCVGMPTHHAYRIGNIGNIDTCGIDGWGSGQNLIVRPPGNAPALVVQVHCDFSVYEGMDYRQYHSITKWISGKAEPKYAL